MKGIASKYPKGPQIRTVLPWPYIRYKVITHLENAKLCIMPGRYKVFSLVAGKKKKNI